MSEMCHCMNASKDPDFFSFSLFPVDGAYSPWTEWSTCSHQCGQGLKHRRRHCDNPKPSNGGRKCRGTHKQAKPCYGRHCHGKEIVQFHMHYWLVLIHKSNWVALNSRWRINMWIPFRMDYSPVQMSSPLSTVPNITQLCAVILSSVF